VTTHRPSLWLQRELERSHSPSCDTPVTWFTTGRCSTRTPVSRRAERTGYTRFRPATQRLSLDGLRSRSRSPRETSSEFQAAGMAALTRDDHANAVRVIPTSQPADVVDPAGHRRHLLSVSPAERPPSPSTAPSPINRGLRTDTIPRGGAPAGSALLACCKSARSAISPGVGVAPRVPQTLVDSRVVGWPRSFPRPEPAAPRVDGVHSMV
jgi:hypothetical protein